MSKYKEINPTAGRVGAMLRRARHVCGMSTDDAAALIRVLPHELFEYERGITEIPPEVLESLFIMGYKMKRIRILEKRYATERAFFRYIKKTSTDAS